jgi:hypothetical protein
MLRPQEASSQPLRTNQTELEVTTLTRRPAMISRADDLAQ